MTNLVRLMQIPVLTGLLLASAVVQAQDEDAHLPNQQTASPTQAQSGQPGRSSVFLAGLEGGRFFLFPLLVYKLPISGTLKKGWTLKLGANGLTYKFTLPSGPVTAWAPSGEVLAGYTTSGKAGSFGFVVGPQYRDTFYSRPYRSSLHDKWGVKGEATAVAEVTDMVHLNFTGFYARVNRLYRAQARPLFGHKKGVQAGPELTFLGNPDISRQQYGAAVTSIPLNRRTSLTVHGGYQHHVSVASGAVQHGVYFGASVGFTMGGK